MRTKAELLQLLLDNFDEHFKSGLCNLTMRLFVKQLITSNEYLLLMDTLKRNKPSTLHAFWWPVGHKRPRIEFLNNLLKQL